MKFGATLLAGAALVLSANAGGQTTGLMSGWRFLGCYSDRHPTEGGNRALGAAHVAQDPNSGQACLSYCQRLSTSYVYAGVQDNHCWCDTAINNHDTAQYGVKLEDSYCSGACRATGGQTCGKLSEDSTPYKRHAVSVYTNQQEDGSRVEDYIGSDGEGISSVGDERIQSGRGQ
ncbi:hypothetical protein CC80DRAFT_597869 [Byssothecium circinans]|uniref:WSC domain-containing protein n=1 Tax=Byssothecium circinans TaxID=147558 RepID=A0A6A5TEN4_9PLEO|nr:hypothetical protein CC80DRAFT_597869 [Byssothecium circinans]